MVGGMVHNSTNQNHYQHQQPICSSKFFFYINNASISQHALWLEFLGPNLPRPYQSFVPKLLNVFCCWNRCTMLVVRQIVVIEKRNFCWCWFSLVVELGILRMLIIVLIVEVGPILLLMLKKMLNCRLWLLMLVVILIRCMNFAPFRLP